MAENKPKLSSVLWSVVGLLFTLLIAWYFSRKSQAEANAPASTSPDQYNFNIGGVNVPSVATPSQNPNPVQVTAQGGCCKRCADSSTVSAGKVLSSGDFSQAVFGATSAAAISSAQPTTTTKTTAPIGPKLNAQTNGGMPLPALDWWINDPIFRQAYVMTYNKVIGQANPTIVNGTLNRKRCTNGWNGFKPLDYSLANNPDPTAVMNTVEQAGNDFQSGCKLGTATRLDPLAYTNQSNSLYLSMSSNLTVMLNQLGDKNTGFAAMDLPQDQNVSSFLIN